MKDTSSPAFPQNLISSEHGLTKHQFIATQCLAGIYSNYIPSYPDEVCRIAYDAATALLKLYEKREQ